MTARKRFYLVRVNGNSADTFASNRCMAHALTLAMPDPNDVVEGAVVYSTDAGAARLKQPQRWRSFADWQEWVTP